MDFLYMEFLKEHAYLPMKKTLLKHAYQLSLENFFFFNLTQLSADPFFFFFLN